LLPYKRALVLFKQDAHLKRITFLLAVCIIFPVSAGLYARQDEQYFGFDSSISTKPANGIGSII
jgi:hypothetical protein